MALLERATYGELTVQSLIFETDAGNTVPSSVLKFNDVGTTSSVAMDFINAYTGKILQSGDYSSSASNGVTLVAANNRPFSLLFDDAGAALGAADYRASLSRVLFTVDQTNTITANAIRGQIKANDLVDFTGASSIVACVQGYMELAGTGARTITGRNACLRAALEEGASGTTTVAASSILCGLDITLNSTRTYTETGTFAGIYIGISGGTSNWANGIFIEDGASDIGIDIGNTTTGIAITGTATDGIVISGACSDNGIEISGACTGSAVEIVTGGFAIGLNVNADGTTGVAVSSAFSGTNMLELAGTGSNAGVLISGACANAIDITGNATTAINVDTGTFATGLALAGTLTTGIDIGACVTSINFGTPTGSPFKFIADDTIVSDANQAILVDISGTANAGFIKVILDTNTVKYLPLYDIKTS